MGTRLPSIKNVFKSILKEFDLKHQVGTPAYIFLVQKYKNNEVTSDKYCRGEIAASVDARNYLSLLNSTRLYDELIEKYHVSQNEEKIKKSAARVGLQLPKQYKEF